MLRRLIEARAVTCYCVAATVWTAGWFLMPFPESPPLLVYIHFKQPAVYQVFYWSYLAMWFTTPWFLTSMLVSLLYIFTGRRGNEGRGGRLPRYPEPADQSRLLVFVGEIHHSKRPIASETPHWLSIPERGLYTGIAVFGAIGSGKTSCCMYPFAEQILAYCHDNPERRIGGLVLEVKGDFCHKVRHILAKHGRESDFVEMSLDSPYRYNPLENDLEAYALAYGIASLLNNLYGRGKEPFWQQAYTNLVKFVILLHKVLYGYVTLFDVYECSINPDLLERRIEEGKSRFGRLEWVLVELNRYMNPDGDMKDLGFKPDPDRNRMKARLSDEVLACLKRKGIPYELEIIENTAREDEDCRQQFEAVERWFYNDWRRIEPKLRTSIVEGISVFLSLFDDNPAVKRTFCPPKECYDPELNRDGRYGIPLPPFSELIERGAFIRFRSASDTKPKSFMSPS